LEVRNCIRCGKLFNYLGKPICNGCIEKDEEDFEKVKEYIYDHPKCSISEVAEAIGVSIRKITKFLREERLEVAEGSVGWLTCESCGEEIKTGRYCKECSGGLRERLSSISGIEQDKEPEVELKKANYKSQMHLKHHLKKNK